MCCMMSDEFAGDDAMEVVRLDDVVDVVGLVVTDVRWVYVEAVDV